MAGPGTGGSEPLIGQVIDSRYRIESLLGSGGFGRVYRALQLALDRPVAIKLFSGPGRPERGRFRREARCQAQLRHRACVAVLDFGEIPEGLYLVQEYVEGETLAEWMGRDVIEPIRAATLIARLLDGLAEAHRKGIVHRDVKPANIMVVEGRDGIEPRLLDFGIAKPSDVDATELTRPGTFLGTPRYMSPEQARGEPVDSASDIYAVGVVLYELLAGRPPFHGRDAFAVAVQHITMSPPVLPAHIDPRLAAIASRALHKDPSQRFPSAAAMARALRNLTPGASVAEPAAPDGAASGARRSIAGIGAAAVTLISVVGLALSATTALRPATSPSSRAAETVPGARALRSSGVDATSAQVGGDGSASTSPEVQAPSQVATVEGAPSEPRVLASHTSARRLRPRGAPVAPVESDAALGLDKRQSRLDDLYDRLDLAARHCRCEEGGRLYTALQVSEPTLDMARTASFLERCRAMLGGCDSTNEAAVRAATL